MADFGGALAALRQSAGPFSLMLPTLPHVEAEVRERAALWPEKPQILLGEGAKYAAFRSARAALAASGTVTLELALAQVPMVGAYKVSRIEEQLKHLIKVPSILLPNLILGERAIPEKLQKDCAPASLGAALAEIVRTGESARARSRPSAARPADGAARRRGAQRPCRAGGPSDDRTAGDRPPRSADARARSVATDLPRRRGSRTLSRELPAKLARRPNPARRSPSPPGRRAGRGGPAT